MNSCRHIAVETPAIARRITWNASFWASSRSNFSFPSSMQATLSTSAGAGMIRPFSSRPLSRSPSFQVRRTSIRDRPAAETWYSMATCMSSSTRARRKALENRAYSFAHTARSDGTLPVCRSNPSTSRDTGRASARSTAFELGFIDGRLPNDRSKRATFEFSMVWHGNRDGAAWKGLLHDDVTAAAPNFGEPMACEYATDLSAGKDAEPTQPRPPAESRRPRWITGG